jgi:hypothetical protein
MRTLRIAGAAPSSAARVHTESTTVSSINDDDSNNAVQQQQQQRFNYTHVFRLKEEQYDLVKKFFERKKRGNNLNNGLLRLLMAECLKGRKEVQASSEDIDRALRSVDGNRDDQITFDEFMNLLLLFFSSKENLERRVEQALMIKRQTDSSNRLNASEATEFTQFLNQFYGKLTPSQEELNLNNESSGSSVDESATADANLEVDEFVKRVCPSLESAAFVRWQEAGDDATAEENAKNNQSSV